jgi:hypothetical protein
MRRLLAATALALLLAPAASFAANCPALMAEIDAALPEAQLSEDDRTRVEELRAEGEVLHDAGDHDASIAALEEAKAILGI